MPGCLARWIALLAGLSGAARIEVSKDGRGGHVTYVDGALRASFYFEFGGGDCIAWISVPAVDDWTRDTGLPADRRDEVLRFVAERVHRDHAGSARYTIDPDSISFWSR